MKILLIGPKTESNANENLNNKKKNDRTINLIHIISKFWFVRLA